MWRYASLVATLFLLTSLPANAQSVEFCIGGGSSKFAVQIGGSSEGIKIIPARDSKNFHEASMDAQALNYAVLLPLIGIGLGVGLICLLLVLLACVLMYYLICWGLQLKQDPVT